VQAHLEVRPGALAKCGWLWPATAGSGLAAAGSGQLRPAVVLPRPAVLRSSLAKLWPDLAVVWPDLTRCGQTCTFALVHPSKVHLFIIIPISVYL
jgi:hypothetical protein